MRNLRKTGILVPRRQPYCATATHNTTFWWTWVFCRWS